MAARGPYGSERGPRDREEKTQNNKTYLPGGRAAREKPPVGVGQETDIPNHDERRQYSVRKEEKPESPGKENRGVRGEKERQPNRHRNTKGKKNTQNIGEPRGEVEIDVDGVRPWRDGRVSNLQHHGAEKTPEHSHNTGHEEQERSKEVRRPEPASSNAKERTGQVEVSNVLK
ncbi:Hypothetical predicted protein [Pelobates cultripes]|uniref:Uncharacterized protein n=1 Tax=Pelobates cultripes TaxID=61616 RepID=A0AAD1T1D9_PELCU|nr:Hypothetical predicted protein [Pelobates cultripes]